MIHSPAKALACAVWCSAFFHIAAAADLLPAEARVVSAASAAPASEMAFVIASPQDLVVTLTDLQVPAPLTSASIAVTQNDGLVGMATLTSPVTTATISLPAASGNYTLFVFGTPGSGFSVGTFAACVAPKASPTSCIQAASFSGNITAAGAPNDPTLSTLSMDLTVVSAGTYTFNFTDLTFPVALNQAPTMALLQGASIVQLNITSGSAITLNPGVYRVLSVAQADQTTKAGLYGITIMSPGGAAALLDTAVPVGQMTANPSFSNPSAQMLTLTVTDYAYPAALASASALLTQGGAALGMASVAGGAIGIAAPQSSSLAIWTYAAAGTDSSGTAAAGTYSVDVAGTTDLDTIAQGVSPSGSSSFAYAFVTPLPAAGSYQITGADLQFPSQLTALAVAAAQNGVILQQSPIAATFNVMAAAGPLVILVNAQTPSNGSTSGNGLFDVNVQTAGASASLIYDKTQNVSSTPALFDSQSLTVGVSGSFDATLSDLKFPAEFDTLALVVSRGSEVLGKVYGAGTFTFSSTPGTYQLTFVASPSAMQQFGLYGVKIVPTPPTVTLSSNVSTAGTGGIITLNWTTTNATGCTASGGAFSGSEPTGSGSASVTLSATTTYTLTCTGDGGTAAQSVSVTATAPKSSGGGGVLDGAWWLFGAGYAFINRRRQFARAAQIP